MNIFPWKQKTGSHVKQNQIYQNKNTTRTYSFLQQKSKGSMAKFIIAGKSDCPFFARAELLADQLCSSLPDFSIDKIVLTPENWDPWLRKTCKQKQWEYAGGSPLIWREFLNKGARGTLIGGCDDFLEIINGYYGVSCSKTSAKLLSIAAENKSTKQFVDTLEKLKQEKMSSFNTAFLNFSSDFSVLYNAASLLVKSANVNSEIFLKFYCPSSLSESAENINGIVMELQDCAFNNFGGASICNDLTSAIFGNEIIIVNTDKDTLIDKDILSSLKSFSEELCKQDSPNVKILVCGYFALKVMFLINHFTKGIFSNSLYGLTRFEENRLKSEVAKKLNVRSHQISNVVVWGAVEHYIIDLTSSFVNGYDGAIWGPHIEKFTHNVSKVLYDESWILDELPQHLIPTEKNNLSKAVAMISQFNDLINPSSSGMYSLGCISKGWYDVQDGIPFSFPVTYNDNRISVKTDIPLTEEFQTKIKNTAEAFAKECNQMLESISS